MAETETSSHTGPHSSHASGGAHKGLSAFVKTPKGKITIVAGSALLIGLSLYIRNKNAQAAASSTGTGLTPTSVVAGQPTGGGDYGSSPAPQDSTDLSAIAQGLSGLQAQITALNANGTANVPTGSSGNTTDNANGGVSDTNSSGGGASSVPQQSPTPPTTFQAYMTASEDGTPTASEDDTPTTNPPITNDLGTFQSYLTASEALQGQPSSVIQNSPLIQYEQSTGQPTGTPGATFYQEPGLPAGTGITTYGGKTLSDLYAPGGAFYNPNSSL